MHSPYALAVAGTEPQELSAGFPVAGQAARRRSLRPHPARDRIVDAMRSYGRPISSPKLVEVTGNTLAATVYHLRTLREAGVVELTEEGGARGGVRYLYSLVPGNAAEMSDPVTGLQRACGLLTLPGMADSYPRPVDLDDLARAELELTIELVRPRVEENVRRCAQRADEGALAEAG
jgi:DNA-binding transcriptional ArsR family regulator